MRKEYYVKIILDDSIEGASVTHHQGLGGKMFEITVHPMYNDNPADNLAHELGHVVQSIFQTPSILADPRIKPRRDIYANDSSVTREEAEAMVRNEKEAWEFAGKMRRINKKDRDRHLRSYTDLL
jgi:hypothetical protein